MTIRERETLQRFVDKSHAKGSLHEVVAALASVALKQEQIRIAQAMPGEVAIAKCARCGVDLFAGDDFNMPENNRDASACWRQYGHEGKPCFRNRANPKGPS
jgi:hypothetical protein